MVASVSSSPTADAYEMSPTLASRDSAEHSLLREPSDEFLDIDAVGAKEHRRRLLKLGCSFFLFGLINNVLYVIILSAALDLVPPSTPKGIIAFCNIAPALAAKVGWPYILKGRIRYTKRIIGCCMLSAFGMLIVAFFDSLFMRLLGIGLASFSSGLGELTFLQLSTTYSPPSVAGHSVGYFSSGTGAAGLVGAFLWWEVRGFGVRLGVGMSSLMPFIIPLTYVYLLPRPATFLASPDAYDDHHPPTSTSSMPYTPLTTDEDDMVGEEESSSPPGSKHNVSLSPSDKWRIVRPMLLKYMLPLFCVYLGVAPTLLYPVPSPTEHPFLSKVIHSVRDYYPLWQLVYQTTVFLSRSSISLGVPALPTRLISLPAIIQAIIFLTLTFDVNVFYRINQDPPSPLTAHDIERTRQEREFKIGSVGFADSSGILFASIFAVPMEVTLCRQQVSRGKLLCKGL
ncbi:batten's disease protein Cln3 [Mycena pura]|uniref:Protein BTN n=1 Tax=Mycena pura TaxID=153505 RepID=A0AAD6VMY7_9AGAR|nr:batten's disease protein Cln3 [Mycena pura]